MKYGKHSVWKKVFFSPITLVLLVISSVIVARAIWNIREKAIATDTRLAEARDELAQLQKREDELNRQVGNLSTESGIEYAIRTKYHAIKEGESVAVIVSPDSQLAAAGQIPTSTPATTTARPLRWWQRLLRFVGL